MHEYHERYCRVSKGKNALSVKDMVKAMQFHSYHSMFTKIVLDRSTFFYVARFYYAHYLKTTN